MFKEFLKLDESEDHFLTWFGNSKVVDEEGNPKSVHHGTATQFTSFKTDPHEFNTLWAGDPGVGMLGPFFSESEDNATAFSRLAGNRVSGGQQSKPRVLKVFLRIENPKKFRTLKGAHDDMKEFAAREGILPERGMPNVEAARKLAALYKEWLITQGIDGLTFMEGPPGFRGSTARNKSRVWVTFRNDQIKLA